ncbi:UDP-N-acetylglucosamine 2-epimerase (hydrolyzing) [Candidatus Kaiserbacteria bacterium]|nr:UDP-N-acetylglucosamine 2-epimerase (hydrolyzing) [Candidatus Kaiserbacteria bacterium]
MAKKQAKKKLKIAIVAGSRGEWGYYQPIIREIEKHPDLDYGIIVSNMHLLDRFGSSIDEIRREGFKIDAVVHNTLDGYSRLTMAKSLSIFMLQLPEILHGMQADFVLVGGDRGEQLIAAIVGAHLYLPVGHIQSGEVSGNIDGVTRHAITKFAHLHFAANEDAARRVKKMGEEPFRIHNVGAPQLDDLLGGKVTPKKELFKKLGIPDNGKPLIVVAQHPVTEEFERAGEQMKETLEAVKQFDANVVIVLNNSDAGSNLVTKAIHEHRTPSMRIFPNLAREDYAGLMASADVLVGNSSSGILEAPSFKLPAVNIGNRERGRLQGKNVINAGYVRKEIQNAIAKALSKEFKRSLKNCVNPYGDGKSAKRIVDIIAKTPVSETLLVKKIMY